MYVPQELKKLNEPYDLCPVETELSVGRLAVHKEIPLCASFRMSAFLIAAASFVGLLPLLLYYLFYPAIVAARHGYDEAAIEEDLRGSKVGDRGGEGVARRDDEVLLSLIVPAYNEEDRLLIMLNEAVGYLIRERQAVERMCREALGGGAGCVENVDSGPAPAPAAPFEVIIVDDGSRDGTAALVRTFAASARSLEFPEPSSAAAAVSIRLLVHRKNGGKGRAVRSGMLGARGRLRLMVDADGATEFGGGLRGVLGEMARISELERRMGRGGDTTQAQRMTTTAAAVFGSRAHLEIDSAAVRSPLRTFLMRSFHFFVRNLCSPLVRDTQCGFKLFTSAAAVHLFENLHLRRWAFDTELVVIAELTGVREKRGMGVIVDGVTIGEVGVQWKEVDGSKLDTDKLTLALVSLGMLRDMVCVRVCYSLGIWKIRHIRQ